MIEGQSIDEKRRDFMLHGKPLSEATRPEIECALVRLHEWNRRLLEPQAIRARAIERAQARHPVPPPDPSPKLWVSGILIPMIVLSIMSLVACATVLYWVPVAKLIGLL